MRAWCVVAGLLVTMAICIAGIVLVPIFGTPPPIMRAEKLSTQPDEFFVVTQADPILAQAIANLEKSIEFGAMDETQIDELMGQHGTDKMHYQGNYYRVGIIISEPPVIYAQIMWLSIIGLSASIILLISFTIYKGLTYYK